MNIIFIMKFLIESWIAKFFWVFSRCKGTSGYNFKIRYVGGINQGILAPGIFLTKSLTPSKVKTNRHKYH